VRAKVVAAAGVIMIQAMRAEPLAREHAAFFRVSALRISQRVFEHLLNFINLAGLFIQIWRAN
jgi:hypothetical protein